ncbi:MAG: spore germination protein [Clostridia bacterium]|nr:spore germination protein [Clostridia bacterium]
MKIEEFIKTLKQTFSESDDLKCRELTVAGRRCAFAYIDGGTDKLLLEQDVIVPLKRVSEFNAPYLDALLQTVSYSEDITPLPLINCAGAIAEGDVAFVIEDEDTAFIFSLRKPEKRSVTEPPTSSVLKGPREGFIEELKTNLSLIRRRLKSPDLAVKFFQVGRYSSTTVAVLHVRGIADDKIVQEIEDKIKHIDIDGIIDSAYITSFLQTKKNSFFLQAGTTEKPDVAEAKLLEGRIIILVDGSPIAVTLPYLLFEDVQDGYDYYSADWRASMIRLFRMLGALLTIFLPGAYIALQTYHFQLLPLKFLMTLMAATTGIPFPPAIEMLIVLILFEILNQASLRMPRYLGISLSVVGAIVLGDTAVKSGLISSPSVLVIALSAIGIFCVPDQVGTLSILRLLFLCISAVTGFVGMIILAIIIVGYLSALENFGAPYLAPYAPRINPDLQDGMLKSGTSSIERRPYSIPTANRTRLRKNARK